MTHFSRYKDLNQDRRCLRRGSLRPLHQDDYIQVQQMCLAGDAGQPRLTFYKRYGLRIIDPHFHAYSVRKTLSPLGTGVQDGFTFRSMVQSGACVL